MAGTVLAYVLNPKKAAHRVLKPQERLAPSDPRIEQVRLIRTLLGMAVVVWVALKYDSVESERIVSEAIMHITVSVIVATLAVPLCALAFVLLAHDNVRRETRRVMRYPMVSMGWFLGAAGVFVGAMAGGLVDLKPSHPALWILYLLGLAAFIWTGLFVAIAFFLVPRYLFASADGHLLMPSLLAPTLSWAVAITDLVSPGNNRVPALVAVIVTLGAPVTITAMSVWEAKRVRELYGVTFRGGPQPRRTPIPAQQTPLLGTAVPGQVANASWSAGIGGTLGTFGAARTGRRFPHVRHIIATVLTSGFWAVGYLILYLRWRNRGSRTP
ncbi:hypothetical protein [Yinghuangia soli]|uniref:Uncharacterized protein n=1 Tax=Yinghuangia soli TaxID=2908204 RepID=A0AA41Q2L9_9ACTN|nr:hypothetical protein [Yinghuangia soli]MCF2529820.1 hypothetical protein [Yinghuangia soli]